MIFFLLTILSLYSLLYVYIFYKIQGALTLGVVATSIVIFVMALMISAPVTVHISERNALELLARLMSCLGYTWMGLAFLFFSSSLAIDLCRIIICAGLFHLPSDSCLYVSRGSGTWGPPIRFLSPPEITVIKVVHGDTLEAARECEHLNSTLFTQLSSTPHIGAF